MSLIHLARQGFITKSALPNVTRQRGTTTGTANLMLFGAGKDHSIGTNTTFTDSSTNNFTVTRNGDTIQATNNPFTGSVYFDGNGDYLSNSTNNSSIAFGSGNFTLEFYIYNTSTATQVIYDTRINVGGSVYDDGGFQIYRDSTTIYVYDTTGAGTLLASTSISTNVWTHFAVVRSGSAAGNVKLYKDGVLASSSASANTTNYTKGYLNIGTWLPAGVPSNFFVGYLSNFRIVKGTAVYTSNFTVPTSPLTAITNTQLLLLTAQQAPFRDSSTNNFTVTANGNAAGSGLEPFPVNYAGSAYFDGNGDYLSLASNAAFDFGTGDFTVECWVYYPPISNANGKTIIDSRPTSTNGSYWILGTNSSGVVSFTTMTTGGITLSDTTARPDQWVHYAATRAGTSLRLFANGTQVASATNSDNILSSGLTIGKNAFSSFATDTWWLGYISNVRIIKGTAQYTANFTPPAAPLTAVTNTSLLLLTNNVGPFVDTSANGFPVLRNGDAVQTGFSPFTGQPSAGSAYFDGTGDYLNSSLTSIGNFGTGDFTVECWIYASSTATLNIIDFRGSAGTGDGFRLAFGSTAGGTANKVIAGWGTSDQVLVATNIANTGQWYHVAVTRSGTTARLFIDGVQNSSATNSVSIPDSGLIVASYRGTTAYYQGYISNLRIVKGTALYTSNFTPATAPLPAVPNTSLLLNTDNYTIANSTPTYLPVTVNGNTTVSTAQYPTGMNRSIYFDGSGDYLRISDNAAVELGANDFTIEMFVNFNSLPPSSLTYSFFISKWAGAQGAYNFHLSNVSNLYYLNFDYSTNGNTSFQLSVPWTPSVSTWYHIALVRNSTNLLFFVNGTQQGSTQTISGTIHNSNAAFVVGAYLEAVNFFHGYMSNLRLTVGSALYTANFTPPAAPLPLSVTVPAFVTNNIYGVYQLA